ncbi:hypothetical protein BDC45DRAFT_515689 [Circinella umbellata]|nr:hypothetical protein BDC45DRAFT_515689 [Circinella umbellata]
MKFLRFRSKGRIIRILLYQKTKIANMKLTGAVVLLYINIMCIPAAANREGTSLSLYFIKDEIK